MLAFVAGIFVKKIEIEEKYIKPTFIIATKKNKETQEVVALTLYYDKDYFKYEDNLLNNINGSPIEMEKEEIE